AYDYHKISLLLQPDNQRFAGALLQIVGLGNMHKTTVVGGCCAGQHDAIIIPAPDNQRTDLMKLSGVWTFTVTPLSRGMAQGEVITIMLELASSRFQVISQPCGSVSERLTSSQEQ